MASIGLRKPFYAVYNYDEATDAVSYTGGGIMAKAITFSASIEGAEENILYADDGAAETDRSFGSGTISLTTDDLTQDISKAILGLAESKITIGSDEITELVYDENMNSPYLGFGVIIPKKKNGAPCFRAVILPKVSFSVPAEDAQTKQGSIEWKTPTIEGTIMRSDAEGHPWKREVTVPTEALAIAYIKQVLNIASTPVTPEEGA